MDRLSLHRAVQTPYKHPNLVLMPSYRAGAFDSHAVDAPFLFWHDQRWQMTYIGWDGIGYQTGLASSDDLLHWEKAGCILARGLQGSVTAFNVALTSILRENTLDGPGRLRRVQGKLIGTYHAYPQPGYEAGPAVIGLCVAEDLHTWTVGPPVLQPDPAYAWEAGGLYKSWLLESDGQYYLFYNAKNRATWPWIEQIGCATSPDLVTWTRHPANPLLTVGAQGCFDDQFASDPCILRMQDTWVMFYYGLCSDGYARDGVAFSEDLITWHKGDGVLVDVGPSGSIDSRYAHKPGIITAHDQLYHFYCAVAPAASPALGEITHAEVRGIAVAMQRDPGVPGMHRAP